ncbi:hypothetical protein [Pedobacter sp. L105]|uniref:hypothetical protein n=1 Tax=Pedobacter sp. L105 TaxID=1641871 RepID=UPI00131E60D5|nr:hypothetical protein [Pedobacter sp. L105]
MDILSYLSELLQTRKAIGIAGLGTLYKKKKPGRYHVETHSFIPPGYILDFTTEIKEEALLTNLISKDRGVSADTANYFIGEFSAALHQQLNDHQEASLGSLGKLYKVNEELKFEPADQLNYGFDFYGLPPIKADAPAAEEASFLTEEPVQESAQPEEIILETTVVEEPIHVAEEIIPEILPAAEEEVATEEPVQESPITEEVLPAEETVEEKPTIESVVADNESLEENPGDEETTRTNIQKEEARLRAEIEALNFYRAQTTEAKAFVPEPMETIWDLNSPEAKTAANKATEPKPAEEVKPINVFQPEEEISTSSSSYIKIILCIIIVILMLTAAYFVNPQWFKGLVATTPAPQKTAKSGQIREVYPNPDSAIVTDSTKKITDHTKPAVAPIVEAEPVDTTSTYEIIGASMHDQKEADNFIKLMAKSGIKAKVVTHMAGKRLKISIATLKDEKTAKLTQDSLSKKLKIPGIYIYRNKQ